MRRVALLLCAIGLAGCADPTGPETNIDGKQLYLQYCARCHGPKGEGVDEQGATKNRLDNEVVMRGLSDEQVIGVITMGKPPAMPGFSSEFTEAKLMVIAAFVRSLSVPQPGGGEAQGGS